MLILLTKNRLPWSHLKNEKDILNLKMVSNSKICINMPPYFQAYFDYVSNLEFEQDPDYDFLIDLFEKI